METLLSMSRGSLGTLFGMLCLGGIGLGLLVGLTQRLAERVGIRYVLPGIALIAVLIWGIRYLQAPKIEYVDRKIDKRFEVPVEKIVTVVKPVEKIVTVEKPVDRIVTVEKPVDRIVREVVKDTTESNSLKAEMANLRAQLAKSKEDYDLIHYLYDNAKNLNVAYEAELKRRGSVPRDNESPFEKLYKAAALRPVHEVKENGSSFYLTRYEVIGNLLVGSTYSCTRDRAAEGAFAKDVSISAWDKGGKPVGGNAYSCKANEYIVVPSRDGSPDFVALKASLDGGTTKLLMHRRRIEYYIAQIGAR